MDTWEIYQDTLEGRSVPIFIRNMQYHLTTADIYSNGSIFVWETVDLSLLDEKFRKGWIWPAPPNGGRISIFNLGLSDCTDGEWLQTPQTLRSMIHSILKSLNPKLEGLINMAGSQLEEKGTIQIVKGGFSHPFKRLEDGTKIIGKNVPIFVCDGGGQIRLDRLFIFADGSLRLAAVKSFTDLETVKAEFASGRLATSVPDGARVMIVGLGSFTVSRGLWRVQPQERIREIESIAALLKGGADPIQVCRAAFQTYQKYPVPENLRALKSAYEAVPEHLRCYCGDMDTKDNLIRKTLYGNGIGESPI